jgi:hypothetical protein
VATAICPRGYSLPESPVRRYARTGVVIAGILFAACAPAQQIGISIDRMEGPSLAASRITGVLREDSATTALELQIGELAVAGQNWRNVRLACPALKQERDQLICAEGVLESPAKIPLSFRYSSQTRNLDLVLRPAPNEEWRFTLETGAGVRKFTLDLVNASAARLNAWWPAAWPRSNAGTVSGRLTYSEERDAAFAADVALINFGFADDSGSHAGEKIVTRLVVSAQQRGPQWQWQGRLEWKSGDVFWQPLFVGGGGHAVEANGTFDAQRVTVGRGRLTLAGIADVDFGATYDRAGAQLTAANIKSSNVEIATLYEKLLKPALQGTALADLRCDGHADIALDIKAGAIVAADAVFRRVSVEDNGRRFALFGLNGSLPWHHEELKSARLQVAGGEILHVPFGPFELPFDTRGLRVRIHDVQIPVLDGKLTVSDFATSGERDTWRWRFTGAIVPISMQQLTTALGLPVMHGTLSAVIPTVSYRESTIKADGALLFKVFDGTVSARNLALENPLGKVPRLTADVDMRNLDLDLLTRTYSFGNITGRVDAEVKALELVNWEAVRFDVRVASSAGDYPRRISQAAVQNISALGGAGAAAAIQRSFLRFFETFGYSALGWSCKLEIGVCQMGGIENVPQGYVIVKGGGIPAISVLGYNRSVGWRELLERLKRVTEGNVIVK